jgi:hypothetical protein
MQCDSETERNFDLVHYVSKVKILKEKLLCRIPMLIGVLVLISAYFAD